VTFLPRSGCDLQPNVAALRGYVGLEVYIGNINREAVAAFLATMPQPLRGWPVAKILWFLGRGARTNRAALRLHHGLYRCADAHGFQSFANFLEPQAVSDQLLDRQYLRFQ